MSKDRKPNQQLVNQLWLMMVKLLEVTMSDLMKEIVRLEDNFDRGSDEWKSAQRLKEGFNGIHAMYLDERKKYPHLLENEPESMVEAIDRFKAELDENGI